MERTGTKFDMTPDTFTLENMFAMELHKHGGIIGDIVTSAVKELGIEKVVQNHRVTVNPPYTTGVQNSVSVSLQGVRDVVETWENLKFNVQRYFKGTQERGYILGSVDEIQQNLDDDAMNLQSMAGSRFVGPFLSVIQQWEKNLSLIGEVIEVSASLA